jgi:hypothetical protein
MFNTILFTVSRFGNLERRKNIREEAIRMNRVKEN